MKKINKNIESKVRPRFKTTKLQFQRYFGLQCYQSSKANAFSKPQTSDVNKISVEYIMSLEFISFNCILLKYSVVAHK